MAQTVKSSALKIAMAMHPDAQVRGHEIVGLTRYNFSPELNCLEVRPDGRLLILDFSLHAARSIEGCDGITNCCRGDVDLQKDIHDVVRRKVAELPDDLILAVRWVKGGAEFTFVKELFINVEPVDIMLTLHTNDLGKNTLRPADIPELLELNSSNQDWWIEQQMRTGASAENFAERVLKPLQEKRLCDSVFLLLHNKVDGWKNRRYYMTQRKLAKWFPMLPAADAAEFDLVVQPPSAYLNTPYRIRGINLSLTKMIAMFGGDRAGRTYIEAMKEKAF